MKLFLISLTYVSYVLSLNVIRLKASEFMDKHGVEGWISYYISRLAGMTVLLGIATTWIKGNF